MLYQFGKGEDGNYPAALVFDHSGSLYGTTQAGGTHGYGTIFKLQLILGKWTEHVLHNFIGTDGSSPWASVTFDRAGNLYGITTTGGEDNYGVVFQLSPASGGRWIEHVIHAFTGGADGSEPQAGVVFDSAGNLYSASVYGGTHSAGNIFELTKQSNQSWKETVLYNFTGGADGASPWDNAHFGLRRPSLRHHLRRRHHLSYRLRACAHIPRMKGDRTLHLPRRKHRPLPRWRPDPRFPRQSLWHSLKRRRRQPRSSLRNHGRRRKPVAHCPSLKALT